MAPAHECPDCWVGLSMTEDDSGNLEFECPRCGDSFYGHRDGDSLILEGKL